ncbi:substrate-binding domain-containing protein [Flexivirga endophytica]|uniref:substrate-binding domain-containing protein n=1 Tax=Flexivirga endophytica TaxID=1849103 RepID=UPI0016655CC5|nr:substrate-binding domain-containing protein [Flexivirga endophytica]
MSRRQGRHRSSQPAGSTQIRHRVADSRNRGAMAAIVAAVCVLAVAGTAVAVTRPWQDDTRSATRSSTAGTTTTKPSSGANAQVVQVWTGTSDTSLINRLADTIGPAYRIAPAKTAGDADVELRPGTSNDDPALVATSPVVLAMPSAMATAFGAPTTDNLQGWFNRKNTWSTEGHAEWGDFRLAIPDPATSATGAIGYGALLTAVNGKPVGKTPDYTHPTPATFAMVHVEQLTVVEKSDSAARDLLNAPDTAAFAKTASAVLSTEREVAAHNARTGANQLVGVPLLGGAAAVPIVATPANGFSKSKFQVLLTHLRSPAGQQALRASGYRSRTGERPGIDGASDLAKPAAVTADSFKTARSAWQTAHRRNSTVALLDLSGSMTEKFPGTKTPKVVMMQQLLKLAFTLASPQQRSTMWFFANRAKGPVFDDVPLALDSPAHIKDIHAALDRAKPGGGTPVYLAIERAYKYAVDHYTPGRANRVIVLSDGANEDAGNHVTLAQVKAYVAKYYDPKKPVTLSMVLLDPGGNYKGLEQVAAVTKGSATTLRKMSEAPNVFQEALFG